MISEGLQAKYSGLYMPEMKISINRRKTFTDFPLPMQTFDSPLILLPSPLSPRNVILEITLGCRGALTGIGGALWGIQLPDHEGR